MSKKAIPATKQFIQLFEKIERLKDGINISLADWTGYDKNWVKKNLSKTFQYLSEDQKKEFEYKTIYLSVLKQKLWADCYATRFEEIKDYLVKQSIIKFNEKKQLIECEHESEIKLEIKKAIASFKENVNKILKSNS